MHLLCTVLLISGLAFGQATEAPKEAQESTANPAPAHQAVTAPDPNTATIPAGTKVPLVLKQAISTKNAREGDAVYAETAFPFVINDRVLIPAGTYIQGRFHTPSARLAANVRKF